MVQHLRNESLNSVLEFILNPPGIAHYSEVIAHNLGLELKYVGELIVEINAAHPEFLEIENSDGSGNYSIRVPHGAREKVEQFLEQGGYIGVEMELARH